LNRKDPYLDGPLDKNDKITLGLAGALAAFLMFRKKPAQDPVLTRTQMIDEIMFRCEQQTEGCETARPTLETMSDDQLRLILAEIRKQSGE